MDTETLQWLVIGVLYLALVKMDFKLWRYETKANGTKLSMLYFWIKDRLEEAR